jgi:hypothetical protein
MIRHHEIRKQLFFLKFSPGLFYGVPYFTYYFLYCMCIVLNVFVLFKNVLLLMSRPQT